MRSAVLLAGLAGLAIVISACSTSRSGSGAGSERSVVDITMGPSSSRGYSSNTGRTRDRYEDLRQQISQYNREYYERRVRLRDAAGNPVRPVDQVEFLDVRANVPAKAVTTAGAKSVVGDTGEEAEFIDSKGNQIRLSDYRGKPVILVFTRGFPGYICPMCTTYTAQITSQYDRIKASGAEVLLVFPGETSEVDDFVAACDEILQEEGTGSLPFPVLLDPDLKAVRKFNILADLSLPATYIFDGQGEMRWGFVGEQPHERPSVDVILEQLGTLPN